MTKPAVDYRFLPRRAKLLARGERCDLAAAILEDSSSQLLARVQESAAECQADSREELARLHGVANVCVREAMRLVKEGLAAVTVAPESPPAVGVGARNEPSRE